MYCGLVDLETYHCLLQSKLCPAKELNPALCYWKDLMNVPLTEPQALANESHAVGSQFDSWFVAENLRVEHCVAAVPKMANCKQNQRAKAEPAFSSG